MKVSCPKAKYQSLFCKAIKASQPLMLACSILCKLLSEKSHTAKLWVDYLQFVDILKSFIVAKRTGNWEQPLKFERFQLYVAVICSQHHVNYVKSGFVYLQYMWELNVSSLCLCGSKTSM